MSVEDTNTCVEDTNTCVEEVKLPPLSYSSMEVFKQCPRRYWATRIAAHEVELEESTHEAAIWGSDVHKALEEFLRDGVPLPERFKEFADYARQLRSFAESRDGELYIEHKLAVDEDMNPVPFDSESVRYRGIIDYLFVSGDVAYLLDHKTGKVRVTDQLALNALLVFAAFPQVQRVKAVFYWLKVNTYTRLTYDRDYAQSLEQSVFRPVAEQIKQAIVANQWPAKPSPLCKWCPYVQCDQRI